MSTSVRGEYLGMPLVINELEHDYREFFGYCAKHDLHLQNCDDCKMFRYPPTTACPFCASPKATWKPVEGKGTLYSYGEIHHAIQPVFRQYSPYMLLLVELDTQKGKPGEFDGVALYRQSGHCGRRSGPAGNGAQRWHRHTVAHRVQGRGRGHFHAAMDHR